MDNDSYPQKNSLNDGQVVSSLLRTWVSNVLNSDHDDYEELLKRIDESARKLAGIFLGQDERYHHTKWNSPDNIDVWLAEKAGVDSQDPTERVAGALLDMLNKLYTLQKDVNANSLLPEQWQPAMNAIIDEYVMLFMGILVIDEDEEKSADVRESADSVSSGALSNIAVQGNSGRRIIRGDDRE